MERYDFFKFFNYSDLLSYLERVNRPDFIFEHLIFIFSKLNIDFNYLFFIVTVVSVFSVFKFIAKVAENMFSQYFKLSITIVLLTMFSFSPPDLISGIRFALASSIFIWAVYYFLIKPNRIKGVLFMVLAILTHFSLSFFIPVLLLSVYWPKSLNPRVFLAVSLLFIFLPKEFLFNIFEFLSLPQTYSSKANLYLETETEFSANAIILSYIEKIWLLFIAYYFVFKNKEQNTKLYYMCIISFGLINITYSIPLVFDRYTILLKLLITTYIIVLHINKKIKAIYFYIFMSLSLISFLVGIYVLRENILVSYSIDNLITLVHIFSNKMTQLDIL